ncbi:MAG TPA: undecaprenyldiphospho-muramoylpentapeptide beta-N-acetylglucosaminyltransferase [Candidatus Avacidaminococcus intestinavium]|uniref:UDP-N-acetylglucosamine--N-acetylmuramyl-(pentapeptide) pyrophosphoryl-undecaprenol N-acetylglucosamine transferase n=1 Tax=Candidatus Avacidaminococcus intestinavium TaxID=2840684 RepID=A0A9D1MNG3_9FIRM|nr:undecaprenyldiphospho-muramoylpentapeptide beta-N-acetylglucosaminyltransferase [Candidatus Avacidaminococcus intestinavium]
MRIIISGGGTGGHIYPALTIAEQIKKNQPSSDITFVGTQAGLERDIVPRYGYPLEFIEIAGFERKLSKDTFKSVFKLFKGLQQARQLVKKIQPELVIGTGGYVCGPVLLLAALKGIPTCIQEQNAMPGVTNKILSYFVNKVFLGYAEAEQYFGGKSQKVFTGNPVREELLTAKRSQAIVALGLDPNKKTVLISGGSRGARSINQAMLVVNETLANSKKLQIIHVTGTAGYEETCKKLSKTVLQANNIKIVPYLHDMPQALALTDLAVFRAGAIGLAELTALGVPSILIPYPYATANHQEFNAQALAKAGAAVVIKDSDLTGKILLEQLAIILQNENKLKEMQKEAIGLGRPHAAVDIANQALALVKA